MIVIQVAPAAPAERATRWLRLQDFNPNWSCTTFLIQVWCLLEQLNLKMESCKYAVEVIFVRIQEKRLEQTSYVH